MEHRGGALAGGVGGGGGGSGAVGNANGGSGGGVVGGGSGSGSGDSAVRRRGLVGDVSLIVCVLLIACAAAVYAHMAGRGADSVVISIGGELWREALLGADALLEYDSGGCRIVVSIENGQARMEEANCPDKLCVKQGAIDNTAATRSIIVCLPNKATVRLAGGAGAGGGGEGGGTGDGPVIDVIVGAHWGAGLAAAAQGNE